MSKKTIAIPTNVGSNMLSETFGKITFSTEVRDMLSAIDAELVVRYIPGAEKPVVGIFDKAGQKVCSLEEFKALSGYRRFINDAMKEVDKATSTTEKVNIISFFIRRATASGVVLPARILESNYTKFNQFGSNLQSLAKHIDAVDGTVDNDWKDYVQNNLIRVTRIMYSAQKMCMGPDIVDKDYVDTQLFNMKVPKWIYNKFLDRNFTNNLKNDCITLLFPKNNYLKSIAFSTKELADEPFLTANNKLLVNSGGIIALSRVDYSDVYPKRNSVTEEQIESFVQNYQWVLTNPYTVDQVLALRETGKLPPVFKEAMPSRNSGSNQRPESEFSEFTRQITNTLGRVQATWNGILNFVIPVSNPIGDFWQTLYPNAENWEITPTNTTYNCIRNEGNLNPLEALRNATSLEVLQLISNIVAAVNGIPAGSQSCDTFDTAFLAIHNRQAFHERNAFVDSINMDHPMLNMAGLEAQPITQDETVFAKSFLGLKKQRSSKVKRSGASGVRLDTSVLNELILFKDNPLHDQITDWLRSSFKTGKRKVLQRIAAERIIGEALKHQETIFGNELGIEVFEELEAYYDE